MALKPNIVEIFGEAQSGCATFRGVLDARAEPKLTPWAEIIGNSFTAQSLPDVSDKVAITMFYNRVFSFIDADS